MNILKTKKLSLFFLQCISILVSILIAISVFPMDIVNASGDEIEVWDGTKASSFAGGEGTVESPWLIENASQLYKMLVEYHTYSASYGKYFKLTKDIYLNDVVDGTSVENISNKNNWLREYGSAIANASKANSFNGNLNGDNHTIYGLYIENAKNAGFFPAISSYAVIENLSFDNLYIAGGAGFAGAIAGQAIYYTWKNGAKITNCSVVNANISRTGTGDAMVGGFVGDMKECTIDFTNCYAYNLVLSDNVGPGGIVGHAYNGGTLRMTNCYSIGYYPVRANVSKANCTNVYTDTARPDGNTTANLTVLTPDQMKGENAKQYMSGFEFGGVWTVKEGEYPKLYKKPDYVWDGTKAENFAGGEGTDEKPYLIETPEQLYKMLLEYSNADVSNGVYFEITKDIYLNDVADGTHVKDLIVKENWLKSYGTTTLPNGSKTNAFAGSLNGNGHTIYGLYTKGAGRSGLFHTIIQGAVIKNLSFENVYLVDGSGYGGAIAGRAHWVSGKSNAKITNCSVNNAIIGGNMEYSGGFIGNMNDCNADITNCYSYNVSLSNWESRGLGGGIFGNIDYSSGNKVTLTNCYSAGNFIVNSKVNKTKGAINCINVYTNVAVPDGNSETDVIVLTDEQMKGENAKTYMSGFAFGRDWDTVENGYPKPNTTYVRPDYIWDGTKAENFAGGKGTKESPFEIENGAQLFKMVAEFSNASTGKDAENTKTYFKITKDIYLNDVYAGDLLNPTVDFWNLVGFNAWYSLSGQGKGFCGELDGDGHNIYGLYANGAFSGLIPLLADGGSVMNLNLKNSFINGSTQNDSAGGIVGYVYSYYKKSPVSVTYCTVDNIVVNGASSRVGGIVGGFYDLKVTVTNCSVTNTKLKSTHATEGDYVSGIVGYGGANSVKATVSNCFTDSSVHPVNATTDKTNFDKIANKVDYTNVYTSATTNFEVDGIKYLTVEQMQGDNAAKYMKGLDFVSIWAIVKDSYPVICLDLASIWDGEKADKFAGGKGTASDPYLIENGGQLYKMVAEYSNTPVDKKPNNHTYFKITKDINLANKQWYTLGSTAYPDNKNYSTGFSGIIYGQGHKIYGLSNNIAAASVGLIPIATQGAEIHDLHLVSGNFPKANWNVYVGAAFIGSAIGVSESAEILINGCSVKDFNIASRDASAAFVGYLYSQSVGIYNSYCVDTTVKHDPTTEKRSVNSAAFIAVTAGNDYKNNIIIANSYCVDVSPIPNLNEKFKAITTFSNVYTNYSNYNNSISGIKKLSVEQMKGDAAKKNMVGFDFETFWKTVDGKYPEHSLYVRPAHTWDGSTAEKFAGGDGTPSNPYLIENGSQLYKMVSEYSNSSGESGAENKCVYFKLTKDIYLNDVQQRDLLNTSETNWNAKFKSWYKVTSYSKGFSGDFDGDGYTIYGLYSNGGYSGLIPVLMDGGSVHNVNIRDSYIRGTESGGGLVGFVKAHWTMAPVSVNYCTVDNVIVESTKKYVGGIIGGYGDIKITISDCSVTRAKLTSTSTDNANLVAAFIGNGWGVKGHTISNSFSDSSMHPVIVSTKQEEIDVVLSTTTYTNVYTSAKKTVDVEGVTYLGSDRKLKGTEVSKVLKGLDFNRDWSAVANDYPVIKKNAGSWRYDTNLPGDIWSGKLALYYSSGSGTKESPYIIKTGGELALLANDALNGKTVNKYYKITEDIILNDTSSANWQKNANEWYTGAWAQAFRGHLDGGYHTVSGLYLNKTKDNYTGTNYYGGLFACIGKGAVIEKLGIVNSSLTFTDAVSQRYVGAFAGFVDQYDSSKEKASPEEYPIIRECFADSTVYLDANSCGGFIGCATRPIRVENSYFTGTVKDTGRGLFGYSKMGYTVDEVLVKNFYTADSKFAVLSNSSYDNINCENCYSSSAQDKAGLTRLFIDKMLGKEAKANMTGFDFDKVWVIRGDDETPGLKGFKSDAYSNVMSPEDIVVSFETNCDLVVESITGKAYSKLTLPELSRDGYIFEGWYSFPELDVPFKYDYFPTFDTILYAKWTLDGYVQDFEQYEDTVYDYHEGVEYYRPTVKGYSAKYVHGGAKSMHRLGGTSEYMDFLLFYEEELEIGKTYKMVFYTTTDQDSATADLSLVHLDWPDVYSANKGVSPIGKIENIENGKWVEHTYTFVAESKWVAIRTVGDSSLYFDDFTLYRTDGDADVIGVGGSKTVKTVWIIVIAGIVAVLAVGFVITFILIRKRIKQR